MIVLPGATDVTTYFKMRLTADGTAATGLTAGDFDLQYVRSGAAPVAKVDASLNGNGIGGAHSDSTVIEVDATDQPGLYRVDWVDAAFATGVREVILTVKVATAFTEDLRVELEGFSKALFDRALTGATHNVNNSLGKRVRIMQESGSYEGGAVWIDTTANGTAGTTSFENGVDILPVDSIADANTIAGNVGLTRFQVAPGSAITFPGTQSNELWEGRDWTLALASRDITGSFIFGASVTGISTATGEYEFEECDIGAVTMDDDGHFERCALEGLFTIGQAGTFTFHNCFTESLSAITIDFVALGATTVHLYNFDGEINFKNMAAGDKVHITGAGTITTETCTAGTIEHDGFFEYTDAGGNVTEVQSDIKVAVDDLAALITPALGNRTNLVLQSEVFSTTWVPTGTTITDDEVTAPDGNVTMDAIIETVGLSQHSIDQTVSEVISTAYTFSVFAKKRAGGEDWAWLLDSNANQGKFFNLSTGAVEADLTAAPDDAGIENLGGGMYRLWIVTTAATSSDNTVRIGSSVDGSIIDYVGDTAFGVLLWGAQLEAGTAPTTYISTTTVAVMRAITPSELDPLIAAIKVKTDLLPSGISKNVALANFEFLMVASADHFTPKTGLTITTTRSIDGAAFGAAANSASEVASGIYKINLAATDLNGDVITLRFTATDADDRLVTIATST